MRRTIHHALLTVLLLASCGAVFTALAGDDELKTEAEKAIKVFQNADSSLTNLFSGSAGFAIFPNVGKGGFVIGGERGKGLVYEKGKPVGQATVTEINVGAQVGGQSFYEVIFFETDDALAHFKKAILN